MVAHAFEATWSGWLRERYLADLHADAEICRQRADAAFRWLLVASPELVGNAAYDLLLAERLHRRSVGAVVRFEAFVTAPGWYRVGVRHTEYFAVHYDVVPPNRNQHRDMRLGLNFVGDEREPPSLRTRHRDVRIGIWRRLYARGRLFSVERTLTATEQAFTDAGGYIAVYRPKADYAFLFERHIPDGVEFLPYEVTDWLNRHAPGWRFIDRRRHVGGNTVWQDTVVVFEGREDADAFRTRWAQFLNLCETAGLARAVDLAQEAVSMATLEVRMSNRKKRVSTVEALLAAHRRMNRLLSRILRLQPSARV